MKKIYLLFLFAFIKLMISPNSSLAQTQVMNKWYKTTVDLTVQSVPADSIPPADAKGTTPNTDLLKNAVGTGNATLKKKAISYRVLPGTKFTVVDISNSNNYVIVFGIYNRTMEKEKKGTADAQKNLSSLSKSKLETYPTDSAFVGQWANYKTFSISPTDLSNKCVVYNTPSFDFTYGALTLPLKVRFGNSKNIYAAYEENLNLGLTFGLKWSLSGTHSQSISGIVLAGVTAVNLGSFGERVRRMSRYSDKN